MGLLDTNYQDQRLTASQKKKIKPAIQGGGYNYLGKQEEVTVPRKWLSDPNHVVAELAYITPREKKVLIDLNMYGSLDGKPNNAPGGLPSLQGDMGGFGGTGGGGGGGGGFGGGGGGGRDYSPPSRPSTPPSKPSKPSTPSTPPGGKGRQDTESQYGGSPYDSSKNVSERGTGFTYGANSPTVPAPVAPVTENIIDPGFVRALDEKARFETSLADPDPYVDVPIEERDTITSFLDNYAANVRANPFELGLIGALKTAYQTGQARDMMRGLPGYSFLGSGLRDDTTSPERGGDTITTTTTTQPTTTTPVASLPLSMVNQYFANMGNMGQSLSSSLQTSYNNAKNSINNILGITPPSQQFGYSADPYGGLMASNLTTNPYNIDYLRRLGLI